MAFSPIRSDLGILRFIPALFIALSPFGERLTNFIPFVTRNFKCLIFEFFLDNNKFRKKKQYAIINE